MDWSVYAFVVSTFALFTSILAYSNECQRHRRTKRLAESETECLNRQIASLENGTKLLKRENERLTSVVIADLASEIKLLKNKPKSKEILQMLSEMNGDGSVLSIQVMDQDNIYYHTGK